MCGSGRLCLFPHFYAEASRKPEIEYSRQDIDTSWFNEKYGHILTAGLEFAFIFWSICGDSTEVDNHPRNGL